MSGICRTHEAEIINVYRILVKKPEWKRPFQRSGRRLEDIHDKYRSAHSN
jgi:hypothetical protein